MVFHTASPFILEVLKPRLSLCFALLCRCFAVHGFSVLQVNDPQTELVDPALKGTLNVLNSVAKTPSVKRYLSLVLPVLLYLLLVS